ncbi:hypothetical protein CAEBREN_00041 [Caenorhabditis brenneri]|uniref:SXP/RAL-2 family protein Ani s 5-like cation-binding domain-containing protein n=1 Tax=Caenorhabditis brenneri TaxID=135651 RepID=G0P6V7_CAEBE|nr:hypothetical protein CAEBREN_00041 [Caenorhabditis brenneri]
MKISLVFLLLIPVQVYSELNDYKDVRMVTPEDYLEQFDLIVNDTSVCEEETNRKLIVLASHFNKTVDFRVTLTENAKDTERIYNAFVKVTQRIYTAKHIAQSILANRNKSKEEQQLKAKDLDREYPLEMSAMLHILDLDYNYKNVAEVIESSMKDPPHMKKVALELEEYIKEVQNHGYQIAQDLHFLPYISRRDRSEYLKMWRTNYPKAMMIHDHIKGIALRTDEINSVVPNQ